MKKQLDVPPIWTVAMILCVEILNRLLPFFNIGNYLGRWIPLMLFALGVVYIILSIKEFRKFETPIFPRRKPKALITTGIFKVSRNPIYTAFALFILAFAIFRGEILGFIPLGLYVWIITNRFIKGEEAMLLSEFDEAKEWFTTTKRW